MWTRLFLSKSFYLDVSGTDTSQENTYSIVIISVDESLPFIRKTSRDIGDTSCGMVHPASLNETGERNSFMNVDSPAILPDHKLDASTIELNSMVVDVNDGQEIDRDEVTVDDGNIAVEGTIELGATDYIHQMSPKKVRLFSCNQMSIEIYGGCRNFWFRPERSRYDDELVEIADDCMDDAEQTQFTENSGWSCCTRAVSEYLYSLFVKEAECRRKSLSLDLLLIGKSRKEASRMFFEALVLKTRDYAHVEQRNPCDDITIKLRSSMMKSKF